MISSSKSAAFSVFAPPMAAASSCVSRRAMAVAVVYWKIQMARKTNTTVKAPAKAARSFQRSWMRMPRKRGYDVGGGACGVGGGRGVSTDVDGHSAPPLDWAQPYRPGRESAGATGRPAGRAGRVRRSSRCAAAPPTRTPSSSRMAPSWARRARDDAKAASSTSGRRSCSAGRVAGPTRSRDSMIRRSTALRSSRPVSPAVIACRLSDRTTQSSRARAFSARTSPAVSRRSPQWFPGPRTATRCEPPCADVVVISTWPEMMNRMRSAGDPCR